MKVSEVPWDILKNIQKLQWSFIYNNFLGIFVSVYGEHFTKSKINL